MKCSFCGNEVEPGAKFCSNCGTPVNEENPENTSGNESGDNQYGYSTGQADYGYGQSDNNQSGYSYGQSDNSQGSYGYGQSDNGQSGYGYGQSDNSQSGYGYGQFNNGQMNYGQPNYNQPNYGQSGKQVSGTPYLIFSILVTLCCCLPLGIVSIVYASKINSLQKVGDYEGAQQAAKKARLFMIIGVVGGLIGSIALGVLGAFDSISNLSDTGSSIVSEDYDDVDDEEDVDDEDKDSASTAKVTPRGELGDTWDSFTVQVNDTVLTFPCTFADIEGLGLTMDVSSTEEDCVVETDDYELVFFDDPNGNYLMFMACNNTDEAKAIKECAISGIYVADYNVEDGNLTVIFPGGIQIGSNIDDVITKWGEADNVYESDGIATYSWYASDTFNYCTVNVNQETNKVTTIDLDGQDL